MKRNIERQKHIVKLRQTEQMSLKSTKVKCETNRVKCETNRVKCETNRVKCETNRVKFGTNRKIDLSEHRKKKSRQTKI